MALINNSVKLGKGDTNLVLETAGHIYVKVADRFYELDFKNENKGTSTTVINNTTEAPEVDLSGYVSKKYLKSALNNYITVRNWNDVKQTQSMLENALLDGFTESINPITVQTMQLIVGTESLQFDFTDALRDTENVNGDIKFKPNVIGGRFLLLEGDILDCPESYILHYTLDGPSSVQPNPLIYYYARWTVDATKFTLEDPNSPYYVYIKAPKYTVTDADVDSDLEEEPIQDLKSLGSAEFVVSKEAIRIDAEENYYYLLSALITDKSDGSRSIAYTNGFTEILPGQITAYIFKSGDGVQLMDFLNKQFHIGYAAEDGELLDDGVTHDGSYMHWDEHNGLVIKGKITVTGGDLADALENLQKQIDDEIQAWFSDDPNNTNQEGHEHDIPSITSWPANTWYDDDATIPSDVINPTRKKEHIGDLFYIIEGTYAGYVYRFVKQNGSYCWVEVSDNALAEALRIAHEALETANAITEYVNQSLTDGVLTQEEYSNWENFLLNFNNNYTSLIGNYQNLRDQAIAIRNSLSSDPTDPLYISINNAINALTDSNQGKYTLLNNAYNQIIGLIQDIFDEGVTPVGQVDQDLITISNALNNALAGFDSLIADYSNYLQSLQTTINNVNRTLALGSYEYIKAAIRDGDTMINGGLILTSTIILQDVDAAHSGVSAGINGVRTGHWYSLDGGTTYLNDAIGIWLGGDFTDKKYFYDYEPVYNTPGDSSSGISYYTWTKNNSAIPDNTTIPSAVLRHDGSGYFANGNIVWNTDGSGSVAGGKIWWDANGVTNIGGSIFLDGDLNADIIEILKSISDGGFISWNNIIKDSSYYSPDPQPIPIDNSSIYSALASRELFLSRIDNSNGIIDSGHTALGIVNFTKGVRFGTYVSDSTGGAVYKDNNDAWHIETDFLHVRQKLTALELEIQKLSHVGGVIVISPASMVCSKVESYSNYYRCYFNTTDADGRTINNQFVVNDLARMQTFNVTTNRFYWRKVVGVGTNYIDLSKQSGNYASNSDAPMAGDHIVQLGNTSNTSRQSAIIESSYSVANGDTIPFVRLYKNIKTFSLPTPTIDINPGTSVFEGQLKVQTGADVATYMGNLYSYAHNDLANAVTAAQNTANSAATTASNAATTAGNAQTAASNAATAANNAQTAADNAQTTASNAANAASTNASAISVLRDSVSAISGRFDSSGHLTELSSYVLTSNFATLMTQQFDSDGVIIRQNEWLTTTTTASLLSSYFDSSGKLINTSGLVTSASSGTNSFATLFADAVNDEGIAKTATITAYVDNAISGITLTADKIEFKGYTIINGNFKVDNSGNLTIYGAIKASNTVTTQDGVNYVLYAMGNTYLSGDLLSNGTNINITGTHVNISCNSSTSSDTLTLGTSVAQLLLKSPHIKFDGSICLNVKTASASFTVQTTNYLNYQYFLMTNSSACQVTLPTSSNSGRMLLIKRCNATVNLYGPIRRGTSAGTVTYSSLNEGQTAILIWDGSYWSIALTQSSV